MPVKAQNPSDYYEEIPRTFYGGLIAGGNFTQIDGDNYAGYKKVGLNGGGIVYANMGGSVALSMEILFSQKGAHGHLEQTSTIQKFLIRNYDVNLNYVELPFQINYFDKRKSHFGGGFSVSRLISVKETAKTNPAAPIDNFTGKPYSFEPYPFRKMDYNFIIGGSLHMVAGLFLQARFQYSILPIRKGDKVPRDFSGRNEQFSNMWTVRVMYLF